MKTRIKTARVRYVKLSRVFFNQQFNTKNKGMPIYNKTIEYFTCKFKCGEKAKPLSTMEKHEAKCFCNPETRSCRMCKHYIVDDGNVECDIFKLWIVNLDKFKVYNSKGVLIWDKRVEEDKDLFDQITERPFPKSNCMQFELGKKAY